MAFRFLGVLASTGSFSFLRAIAYEIDKNKYDEFSTRSFVASKFLPVCTAHPFRQISSLVSLLHSFSLALASLLRSLVYYFLPSTQSVKGKSARNLNGERRFALASFSPNESSTRMNESWASRKMTAATAWRMVPGPLAC
jgi:hypothetical protein